MFSRLAIAALLLSSMTAITAADSTAYHHSVHGYSIQIGDKMPENSFAIVNGDNTIHFHGNTKDLRLIERLRKQQTGEFIWFRQQGKQYVVDDAQVVADIKHYWSGLQTEEDAMDALQAKMEPLQAEMERIQQQHEALTDEERFNDDDVHVLSKKMRQVSRQMKDIGNQMQEIGWRIEDLSSDAAANTFAALQSAVSQNKAVAVK